MILKKGIPEDVGMSSQKIAYTDSLCPKWIKENITSAIIGQVSRKGVIVYENAHGKLTSESDSPNVKTDTIFPLCSISKIFAATAAMILMEDGLLSINRPVDYYIPEFVGEGKGQVAVHQLLTHTSGLTDEGVDKYVDENRDKIIIPPCEKTQHPDMHNQISLCYGAPLTNEPGKLMSYCSRGIDLIGEVIRRVSGRSLDEFLTERIFKPLGMTRTYLVVPKEVRDQVIKFPDDSEHGKWLSNDNHFEWPSLAGGIYSTVGDMSIFGQMILNKGTYNGTRILSPVSVIEMIHNRIPGISAVYGTETFGEASWGLSWNIFGNKLDTESGPLQSPQAFGHGGAGRSMLWIDPVYQVVGILFYIKMPPEYRRPDDLFRNAIMSAIIEE